MGHRRSLSIISSSSKWWSEFPSCSVIYQPKGSQNITSSYRNLVNPGTYDAAPGLEPTWNSNIGWTFTGTQYLTTEWIPPASQQGSIFIRYSDVIESYGLAVGYYISNSNLFGIRPKHAGAATGFWNGNYIDSSNSTDAGVLGVSGRKCWRNGNHVSTISSGGTSNGAPIEIGRANTNTAFYFRGNIQAICCFDSILSDQDCLNITELISLL